MTVYMALGLVVERLVIPPSGELEKPALKVLLLHTNYDTLVSFIRSNSLGTH